MPKPKYKPGDKVKYVGGMIRYNAKSGAVTSVIEDDDRYYYLTTFTTSSQGSCSECEIKKIKD